MASHSEFPLGVTASRAFYQPADLCQMHRTPSASPLIGHTQATSLAAWRSSIRRPDMRTLVVIIAALILVAALFNPVSGQAGIEHYGSGPGA